MKFLRFNSGSRAGRLPMRVLAVVSLTAALVACGGGGGSAPVKSDSAAPGVVVRQMPMLTGVTGLDTKLVQIKEAALPIADRPTPRVIALGDLPLPKTAPVATTPEPGQPLQIGVERAVAQAADVASTSALLAWAVTADGRRRAAISVQSPAAKGLRLGLRITQLPPGTQLRVYAPNSEQTVTIAGTEVLRSIQRNLDAGATGAEAYTYWLPTVEGNQSTLEFELPADTDPALLKVSLPQLSHLKALPTDSDLLAKASGSCNVDVMCTSGNDANMRAVARMTFVKDGNGYLCTGTLLNNTRQDGTPYFLSANHCISTQAVASSLETYWNYRSSSCNSGVMASNQQRVGGGALLRYASDRTDTSFMQLNAAPASNATYAGWNANPPTGPGANIFGIHHPSGDLQKYSAGAVAGFGNCSATAGGAISCSVVPVGSSTFHGVIWSQGITEGGSSGSALMNGSSQVIGQLYAGASSCSNPKGADFYGRFDIAFDAALSQWLAPSAPATPGVLAPVYRFYNRVTAAHFYTISQLERDYVIANLPAYQFEGTAYQAYNGPTSATSAVYRFYNTQTGVHFYTINAAERDYIIATNPPFRYEGPSWYAQTTGGNGATPLYRFYSALRRAHFYTMSDAERDYVMATYRDFNYEGVAYYAWPAP